MHIHLADTLRQAEGIGQRGPVGGDVVGLQRDAAQRPAHVGYHRPLGSLLSRGAVVVSRLDGEASHGVLGALGQEHVAVLPCLLLAEAEHVGQHVVREIVVPARIADVLLNHHSVPLASGHYLIIIGTEQRVATETTLHLGGPFVGLQAALLVELVVHGLSVVHLVEVAHGLDGEEQQLEVRVVVFSGQLLQQSERVSLQGLVLLHHVEPFARCQVVGVAVQHLSRHPSVVLRVEVQQTGSLSGMLLAQLLCAELRGMLHEVPGRVACGIPCHVEEERDGVLHRLEVTHVEHPELVHPILVGERHLFPEVLYGRHVHPLAVAWSPHVIHVVVHAPPTGALLLLHVGQSPYITPVVVREQYRHVIGHPQSVLIVELHLLVECPHLRTFLGGPSRHLLDDAPLVVDDVLQQGNVLLHVVVGITAHGLVAVTAHTDGDEVLRVLGPLHTLAEERVEHLLVRLVVPLAVLVAAACPLLVVACHGFVVAGTHDDTHLVGQRTVLCVIGIEGPRPHGWPQEVGPEAQQQFEDLLIEGMTSVVCAESILHPSRQAGSLVVEEEAAVGHGGFPCRVASLAEGGIAHLLHRRVGPVVPGRNAQLLREFIDAVYGASLVATHDDQCLVHALHGLLHSQHEILLALALQLLLVQFLGLDESLDEGALQRADKDGTA